MIRLLMLVGRLACECKTRWPSQTSAGILCCGIVSQEVVRNVPLDRILLETDGPYMAYRPQEKSY